MGWNLLQIQTSDQYNHHHDSDNIKDDANDNLGDVDYGDGGDDGDDGGSRVLQEA